MIQKSLRRASWPLAFVLTITTGSAAYADSVLDYIPTVNPPASEALDKAELQSQFNQLDRSYKGLPRKKALPLAAQRNQINRSLQSPGSLNALESLKIQTEMNSLSQRISRAKLFKKPATGIR